MYCPQQISYTIRRGDNLYQLARHYQTTVPMILSLNPNLDPYNLVVGAVISICPGPNFRQAASGNPSTCPMPTKQIALINNMRLVWSQHVYWTRFLIISIAERLKDQEAVTARLLRNPGDLARIYANYYSPEVAQEIARLITEHLQIGAALITALRDGDTAKADTLNRQWYMNADSIAEALGSINPYYNSRELQNMLYRHLDITKQEASQRLAGNYPADIEAFDMAEQEILTMADYLASGILRQFPQKFN